MRFFLSVLSQEKQIREERLFSRSLSRSFRLVLIPASFLLLASYLTSRWLFFAVGAALPAALWALRGKWRRVLSLEETARVVDQDKGLNEVLTTAREFQPRERESQILSALMDDADRRIDGWAPPAPTKGDRLEQIILVILFFALFLLNVLSPFFDSKGKFIRDLRDSVSSFQGDSQQKRELEKTLKEIQAATSEEEEKQATEKMKESVRSGNPDKDLRGMGQALSKQSETQKLGEALAKGDTAEGAKQAADLARKLGSANLSGAQQSSMRQAIENAQQQLSQPSAQDLSDALQEMKNNLDDPQRLQQGAQQLSRELDRLSKQQAGLQQIAKKLEAMTKGSGQKGQPKDGSGKKTENDAHPGKDGQAGKDGVPGKSGQNGQSGQKGQPGQKGEKSEKAGKTGKTGKGGEGAEGAEGKEAGAGNKPGEQGGEKAGNSPWKLPPGMQQNSQQTTMAVGEKQAGGRVTQDPKQIVKDGKSRQVKQGNKILDFKQPAERSKSPQFFADFEKGELLTDQDRSRLQAKQEDLARSREIDEFCQRHRAAPRMKTFLRDFFALPTRN